MSTFTIIRTFFTSSLISHLYSNHKSESLVFNAVRRVHTTPHPQLHPTPPHPIPSHPIRISCCQEQQCRAWLFWEVPESRLDSFFTDILFMTPTLLSMEAPHLSGHIWQSWQALQGWGRHRYGGVGRHLRPQIASRITGDVFEGLGFLNLSLWLCAVLVGPLSSHLICEVMLLPTHTPSPHTFRSVSYGITELGECLRRLNFVSRLH